MPNSIFDIHNLYIGVTPFPDEQYELGLVLYENCSISELESLLTSNVYESVLEQWKLTREQYREEVLFAKTLIEND